MQRREGGILKKANSTACRTFSWLLCCYTKVVHCAPPSQTAAAAQSCILCFLLLRPLRPQLRKNLDDEGREREEGEPFHCCLVAASTTTCAGSASRLRDHAHLPSKGKSINARDKELAGPKTKQDFQVFSDVALEQFATHAETTERA